MAEQLDKIRALPRQEQINFVLGEVARLTEGMDLLNSRVNYIQGQVNNIQIPLPPPAVPAPPPRDDNYLIVIGVLTAFLVAYIFKYWIP